MQTHITQTHTDTHTHMLTCKHTTHTVWHTCTHTHAYMQTRYTHSLTHMHTQIHIYTHKHKTQCWLTIRCAQRGTNSNPNNATCIHRNSLRSQFLQGWWPPQPHRPAQRPPHPQGAEGYATGNQGPLQHITKHTHTLYNYFKNRADL